MKGNVVEFTSTMPEGKQGQIQPLYLAEPFAITYDDSIALCFASDYEQFYVVAISSEEMEKYEDLIYYTYSDTDTVQEPEPVTMKGISTRLTDEMLEYAIKDYNLYAEDVANSSNAEELFGKNYLDTTKELSIDYTIPVIAAIFFALVAWIYSQVIKEGKKAVAVTEDTLGKYSRISLEEVDNELTDQDNTSYPKEKIHFTKNYLVSSNGGFKILRWDDIVHVYGNINKNFPATKHSIIVKTKDDKEYEVYNTYSKEKARSLNSKIVEYISERLPDIKYGHEDGFYSYASSPVYEVILEENNETGFSNYVLGIIGAILFASIGGIGWIVIGRIGFISGLAGALILNLSLHGYQKFAKGINKKGKIIALLVTIIMVLIANYMLYVLDLSEFFYGTAYSMTNIIKSIPKVPEYIGYNNLWGDFAINLAVGFGLTIWVAISSGIINDIFKKDK